MNMNRECFLWLGNCIFTYVVQNISSFISDEFSIINTVYVLLHAVSDLVLGLGQLVRYQEPLLVYWAGLQLLLFSI